MIDAATTAPQPTYSHLGVMWVPHYLKLDTFVAPGGVERTRFWLEAQGARQGTAMLWPRRWTA